MENKKEGEYLVDEFEYGHDIKLRAQVVFAAEDSLSIAKTKEELYGMLESFEQDDIHHLCLIVCDLYYILCPYSRWYDIYQKIEGIFFQILGEEGPFYTRILMAMDFLDEYEETTN